MAEFKSASIAVGSLFSQEWFFYVPVYQRPFSWDEDNFSDLVIDTLNADRGAQYFLGTIVLHKTKEGTTAIVDGQQRITSLLILLACLRDSISDPQYKAGIQDKIMQQKQVIDGIPERVRIDVKEPEIFSKIVVSQGGTLETHDLLGLTRPQTRYIKAANVFHSELTNLTEAQKQELVTFINQK